MTGKILLDIRLGDRVGYHPDYLAEPHWTPDQRRTFANAKRRGTVRSIGPMGRDEHKRAVGVAWDDGQGQVTAGHGGRLIAYAECA